MTTSPSFKPGGKSRKGRREDFLTDDAINWAFGEARRLWLAEDEDRDRIFWTRDFIRARKTSAGTAAYLPKFLDFISRNRGFGVARTLGRDKRESVLHLGREMLGKVLKDDVPPDTAWQAVDAYAEAIRDKRLSAQNKATKRYCLPLSYASKFAMLVMPDVCAPLDSFSTSGLRAFCGGQNFEIEFNPRCYADYMRAFSDFAAFLDVRASLRCRISQDEELCFGKDETFEKNALFHRVADKTLMRLGGFH